jgi:hypothetical protein
MITAEEARKLYRDPKDDLEILDKLIRKAASKGETSIRVPYDLVETNGYSINFKLSEVEVALGNAGFTLNIKSADRQFVDVWIEVSW